MDAYLGISLLGSTHTNISMNLCGVILSVVRCGVDTMASLNQGLDPIGAELFMVRCATYYMFLNLTLCPFQ